MYQRPLVLPETDRTICCVHLVKKFFFFSSSGVRDSKVTNLPRPPRNPDEAECPRSITSWWIIPSCGAQRDSQFLPPFPHGPAFFQSISGIYWWGLKYSAIFLGLQINNFPPFFHKTKQQGYNSWGYKKKVIGKTTPVFFEDILLKKKEKRRYNRRPSSIFPPYDLLD